jgi:hypothetical protein
MTLQAPILATVTTRLRHVVRLVHSSTGAPVRGLIARLSEPAHGWFVRVLPDAVIVSARTDVAEPAVPPQLVITLTDGAVANVLVLPPVTGLPPRTVVADLTAEEVDLPLQPVPMTLSVVLTKPSTGEPRTGATVTARATSGSEPRPTVPLSEAEFEPGLYRSAPVVWTAAFTPLDLHVDGSRLRTVTVDFTKTTSWLHLVDTT